MLDVTKLMHVHSDFAHVKHIFHYLLCLTILLHSSSVRQNFAAYLFKTQTVLMLQC